MVFDVYRNYVEGLGQDIVKKLDYFGKDFIAPEVKQHAVITMQQAMMCSLLFRCIRCHRFNNRLILS